MLKSDHCLSRTWLQVVSMRLIYGLHFNNLRGDLFGGLTAAIVALPLALAFGVSSGAGAAAGLYGAFFVGLFAALFGGTPSQISGPTGPMTVVMASVFTEMVALDPTAGPVLAFTVVMLGGIMQLTFGCLRLGRYITLVPFPVISGFMSGIGVIIIVLQLAPLAGQAPSADVLAALLNLPDLLIRADPLAVSLGLTVVAVIFFCPRSIAAKVPPTLLALVLGTTIYLLIGEGRLDVVGTIPQGLPDLLLPQWRWELLPAMLFASLMLAVLGSIDSLLTSLVADNISGTRHNPDRELVGQGIGNLFAGLFGGLPGAGATMRTVVNIRSGGQTPVSGVVHALVLLLLILGLAPAVGLIPHAVLAGILICVGLHIIDWQFLRRLPQAPLFVSALMLLVLGLTVFVDLVTAVFVGVFLANVVTIKQLSDSQLDSIRVINSLTGNDSVLSKRERKLLAETQGRIVLYLFDGPVSYAAAKGLSDKLRDCLPHDALLLDFSRVPLIDVSTALAVEDMIRESQSVGRSVHLIGMNPIVQDILQRLQVISLIAAENCHQQRRDALERAHRSLLAETPGS